MDVCRCSAECSACGGDQSGVVHSAIASSLLRLNWRASNHPHYTTHTMLISPYLQRDKVPTRVTHIVVVCSVSA